MPADFNALSANLLRPNTRSAAGQAARSVAKLPSKALSGVRSSFAPAAKEVANAASKARDVFRPQWLHGMDFGAENITSGRPLVEAAEKTAKASEFAKMGKVGKAVSKTSAGAKSMGQKAVKGAGKAAAFATLGSAALKSGSQIAKASEGAKSALESQASDYDAARTQSYTPRDISQAVQKAKSLVSSGDITEDQARNYIDLPSRIARATKANKPSKEKGNALTLGEQVGAIGKAGAGKVAKETGKFVGGIFNPFSE